MTAEPDPDQRAGLLAAKLRALVGGRWGTEGERRPGSFRGGSLLVDDAGSRAWVLLDADPERRLGAGLALARRAGVDELHLIVDDPAAAGVIARRASLFDGAPTVWRAEGRDLHEAAPAPPAQDPPPPPGAELYRPLLEAAGLVPVVEAGVLTGELWGLEVARVIVDPGDGSARVEAGVGRFDREASAMMFADLGEGDSLARTVGIVAGYRTQSAARHPLNQLVPERWLRAALVVDPSLVGAAELHPVGSALPRRNLTETGVATAVGTDADGRPVVVVCSTGVDLDLVPSAADDRLTHAPDARLVLALPERDCVPVTTELARRLRSPAEVVTVAGDWKRLVGEPA